MARCAAEIKYLKHCRNRYLYMIVNNSTKHFANLLPIQLLFYIAFFCVAFCNTYNAAAAPISDSIMTSSGDPIAADHFIFNDAPPSGDIDSCLTTAYGEMLYEEGDLRETLSIAEMEIKYQRARMAFLFGNYEYAYRLWEPLAYEGYTRAQATLAWMFHTGKGVKKNMKRALAWYQVAAENDHVIAQNNLGVFYEQGIEVRKNYQKAALWYQKAAEVGYSYAQYNLGVLYLEGKGVKKNKDEAIYWLQIASLQGVKQAISLLEHLGQKGAPKDDVHKAAAVPKKKYHKSALPKNDDIE